MREKKYDREKASRIVKRGGYMKTYRISWYAVVEDDSVLDGRSLIHAQTQEEAIEKLVIKKSHEYRLKPNKVQIQSIWEIPSGESNESSS